MNTTDITKEMIETGRVYVEVYPMKRMDPTTSRIIEGRWETPDFYDVALRPDEGVRPDGTNDPFEEWDNLTADGAIERVTLLEAEYPEISVDWIYG